jgi:hypothetical protein
MDHCCAVSDQSARGSRPRSSAIAFARVAGCAAFLLTAPTLSSQQPAVPRAPAAPVDTVAIVEAVWSVALGPRANRRGSVALLGPNTEHERPALFSSQTLAALVTRGIPVRYGARQVGRDTTSLAIHAWATDSSGAHHLRSTIGRASVHGQCLLRAGETGIYRVTCAAGVCTAEPPNGVTTGANPCEKLPPR